MSTKRRPDNRYVVIHGHFYQPPRENPWIEAIERQPGAAPHHDWNEHIAWECYLPNMVSRVVNDAGKIVDLVNNYRAISFDFGPTLLAWLEHAFPGVYGAILAADAESAAANDGHGNAMAQAYNHMILPLANERDRRTQILWGIEDFRHRFGRDPEGMWLPETAVNNATVRALVAAGIKFIVLAPGQAWRYRPIGAHDWHEVADGSIDPRRPYRVVIEGENRDEPPLEGELAVFFYDGTLAHGVAFDQLLGNAAQLADRIEAAFGAPMLAPARLVNIATDGETYGHHRHFTDMALAYVTKYELPQRGIALTNYAAYLAQFPPEFEVELKPGRAGLGTSWSCAHGVERWQADCGCTTGEPGRHQKWRAPMRRAFDALRDAAAELFEREGGTLFKDPWAARDNYIRLILDRSEQNVGAFMAKHLAVAPEPEARVRALKWLEGQRHAMLMYTSCGWFFDDVSRPEPVQCMLYAARAAQLVRNLTGRDLEAPLVKALAEAPGNTTAFPTGRDVYEKLVRPSILSWERLVAHYAITIGLGDEQVDPDRIYHYRVARLAERRFSANGDLFVAAQLRLTSGVTGESQRALYFLAHLGEDRVYCYVARGAGDKQYAAVVTSLGEHAGDYAEVGIQALARPHFAGEPFSLSDLLYDERERLVTRLLHDRLGAASGQLLELFLDNMGLLKRYHDVGWRVPAVLRASSEYALGEALAERFRDRRDDLTRERVADLADAIAYARALDFAPQLEGAAVVFEAIVLDRVRALRAAQSVENAHALGEALAIDREIGLGARLYRVQNEFFGLLREQAARLLEDGGSDEERQIREIVAEAAEQLGFDLTALRQSAAQQ